MAEDEVHYSSCGDSNKRKYEESSTSPPPPRRSTGFSSPVSAATPTGFELAKQRAQELASRFMNDAEAKRSKFDNGGGFDSALANVPDQKPIPTSSSLGSNPSSAPSVYGYQGSSKKIDIPNNRVGVIIGKGGETIKYLQLQSGAKIQVTRDMDADPNSPTRSVELVGSQDQIAKAEQLIEEVLAETEAGGVASRRLNGQGGSEQFSMKVPNNKVGLVIGKGGETIKNIQARTGARVQVIPLHPPPGDTSNERTVQIDGSSEQIEAAKQIVNEVISENRPRNLGGYSQQNYQARPPTNWAPPGPAQSAYGYMQPTYPGQQQYPAPPSQQHYPGYPPHQSSTGYPSTYWDQSSQQPPAEQTGYDYNHQQQPSSGGGPPQGNSGYGYNQGYGAQGYSQDGYGGGGYNHSSAPQPGYAQQPPPPPNHQQGYDQGNSYGSVTNPPQDATQAPTASSYGSQQGETDQSQAPPQGYNLGQQPYGAQTGYGGGAPPPPGQNNPATSNLPSYSQTGQSPSAHGGGYGQVGGYSSYSQAPPPAAQPYGTVAGAYPLSYSAPPSYGQQQAQPPNQYGGGGDGSYGNPYPQASSGYSVADGSANHAGASTAAQAATNGTGKTENLSAEL